VDNNVHPAKLHSMANALIKGRWKADLSFNATRQRHVMVYGEYSFGKWRLLCAALAFGDNTPPPVDMMEMLRIKPKDK